MTLKKAFQFTLASTAAALVGSVTLGFCDIEFEALYTVITGGIILTYVIGTAFWASAKGYHPLLGVFCGWIGPIGWLCLALSSDQSKQAGSV